MGAEVIVEGGVLGLVHHEGIVGAECAIDGEHGQQIAADDTEDLGGGSEERAAGFPSHPERQQKRGDDDEEMELKEGKKGGVGKVVVQVGGNEPLQSPSQPEVVGQLAEQGLPRIKSGCCHKRGEVAEMQGQHVVEVGNPPGKVVGGRGVKHRGEIGEDDEPDRPVSELPLGSATLGNNGYYEDRQAKEER